MKHLHLVLGLAAALLASGCATDYATVAFASGASRACPDASSETYYFPDDAFDDSNEKIAFEGDSLRKWFSDQLRAMKEPSLSCGEMAGRESFRITILPAFSPAFTTRITRTGARYDVRAIVLSGAGGGDPGVIAQDKQQIISRSDWRDVLQEFERSDFWNLPGPYIPPPGPDGSDRIILDATEVVIEAVSGRYHAIERYLGYGSSELEDLMQILLDQTAPISDPFGDDEDDAS